MTPASSIPRQIFQTAKDRKLTPLARAAATNLRLLHPDWEYYFYSDHDIEQFIASEFPQYYDTFHSFPRAIQRVDFFRYLVVLRYGGFYLDLDVFLCASLDDLLSHSCIFPFEELTLNRYLRAHHGIDWEIGNYAFGATAGHPFLQAIITNCVRSQTDSSWNQQLTQGIPKPFRADFDVLNTTGPGLITRTLAEHPQIARDVFVLYPGDVCDPNNWHRFGQYGVHLMEATWRSRRNPISRKIALLWERWTRSRQLRTSRSLGGTRTFSTPHAA
jgi:inositol phosphorylceramide mannosyltransferase catalytic subunit